MKALDEEHDEYEDDEVEPASEEKLVSPQPLSAFSTDTSNVLDTAVRCRNVVSKGKKRVTKNGWLDSEARLPTKHFPSHCFQQREWGYIWNFEESKKHLNSLLKTSPATEVEELKLKIRALELVQNVCTNPPNLPPGDRGEVHHVLPLSLGGSYSDSKNFVLLSRRQHKIVHVALTLIFPGNISMAVACCYMLGKRSLSSFTEKEKFELLRDESDFLDVLMKADKLARDCVLQAYQEQWNQMYQKLEEFRKEKGHTLVPKGTKLGTWVLTQRQVWRDGNISEERMKKLDDIGFVFDPHEEQWNKMYQKLVAYKDQHGNTLVPWKYMTEDGAALGEWVHHQRQVWRETEGNISEERKKKLEDIGFVFDPFGEQWNKMYQKLVAYKDQYGDTLVPAKYKTEDGARLGTWVHHQGQVWRDGNISEERMKKLDDIGFVFDPREEQWNKMYQKLVAYKDQHGNTSVPHRYKTEDGARLGTWVLTQRQVWRETEGNISEERMKKLEDIGFVFDPREEQWNQMYQELVAYQKQHGNTLVPARYVTKDGAALGKWVHHQGQVCKEGNISEDRKKKLEDVGFFSDRRDLLRGHVRRL